MALSLATSVVALAVAALVVVPADAIDQTIDWSFGTDDGLKKFDILQCQAVTFDWLAGGFHNVWEFPDEESYDTCDFTNAQELAPSAVSGTFTISDDDTLDVTKRWFGCEVGNHCDTGTGGGKMKIAVKIRPLLRQKFPGSECAGGTEDIIKKEPNLKACRKRCKRRRGCFAIQYDSSSTECRIYSEVPTQGMANPDKTCEIATTTCDELPQTPAPTPTPPPAGGTPECSIEVRVGCKLSSDKTTECSDLPDLPTPVNQNDCRVLVNYTYYVKHFGPEGAILKSTIRTREDAFFGGDVRNYQTATVGFPAKDSVLDTWEEDYIDLCKTKTYTTTVETISELASAGLECIESEEYVVDVDPTAKPPTPAPPCDLDVEISCLVGDDEIDCASIEPPTDGSSCSKEIKYKYRLHNVGSTDADILTVLRTRPDAKFNGPFYDLTNTFPTTLAPLFQTTVTEGPYFLNFCDPKRTYETTFDVSATCDGGATTFDAQDYYEFEVV